MRFALLAILLALAAPSAASPPCNPSEPPPRDLYYVVIQGVGTREATFVAPRADGTVFYLEPDGTMGYAPAVRVRQITDEKGVDLTVRTLRRREWLGTPPVKPFRDRPPAVWKRNRLLAGPRSECGSFLITESAMFGRFTAGYARDGEHRYQGVDYGYARSVSSTGSVGASLFLAADGARTHAGLRLRMYRWLSKNASVDVSPGVILLGNEEYSSTFLAPGSPGKLESWDGEGGWDCVLKLCQCVDAGAD